MDSFADGVFYLLSGFIRLTHIFDLIKWGLKCSSGSMSVRPQKVFFNFSEI